MSFEKFSNQRQIAPALSGHIEGGHSLLRSNVTASATSACDISYTNAIFHVLFSSLIQMVENNCVKGTKKNFEDRTNFLVILVQHGGAQIFLQIWLMMAK